MEDLRMKDRLDKVKSYFSHLKDRMKPKRKTARENLKKTVREKEDRDISAI